MMSKLLFTAVAASFIASITGMVFPDPSPADGGDSSFWPEGTDVTGSDYGSDYGYGEGLTLGASYCSHAPDYGCFEGGWPSCCTSDEECPEIKDDCSAVKSDGSGYSWGYGDGGLLDFYDDMGDGQGSGSGMVSGMDFFSKECQSCADKFVTMGGCEDFDNEDLIPTGCDDCGDAAMAFCFGLGQESDGYMGEEDGVEEEDGAPCNGDGGCETDMEFCNFDFGEDGLCEPCMFSQYECENSGLPKKGATDCVNQCALYQGDSGTGEGSGSGSFDFDKGFGFEDAEKEMACALGTTDCVGAMAELDYTDISAVCAAMPRVVACLKKVDCEIANEAVEGFTGLDGLDMCEDVESGCIEAANKCLAKMDDADFNDAFAACDAMVSASDCLQDLPPCEYALDILMEFEVPMECGTLEEVGEFNPFAVCDSGLDKKACKKEKGLCAFDKKEKVCKDCGYKCEDDITNCADFREQASTCAKKCGYEVKTEIAMYMGCDVCGVNSKKKTCKSNGCVWKGGKCGSGEGKDGKDGKGKGKGNGKGKGKGGKNDTP